MIQIIRLPNVSKFQKVQGFHLCSYTPFNIFYKEKNIQLQGLLIFCVSKLKCYPSIHMWLTGLSLFLKIENKD